MSGKIFNSRIQNKYDDEIKWNSLAEFIPLQGEIIVYSSNENKICPRIKIGDGETLLKDLSFVSDFNTTLIDLSVENGKITYIKGDNTTYSFDIVANQIGNLTEESILEMLNNKIGTDIIPLPSLEDANKFLIVNEEGKYEIRQVIAQDIMGKVPVLNENYPADTTYLIVDAEGEDKALSIVIAEQGSPATYFYQWYMDETPIPDATNPTYQLPNKLSDGNHIFYCTVGNSAGVTESRKASVMVTNWYRPTISIQPTYSQKTVGRGESITETVEIIIDKPGVPNEYTYQWYKNSMIIQGATEQTYTINESNFYTDCFYRYSCMVGNAAGYVQTDEFILEVLYRCPPILNDGYPMDATVEKTTSGTQYFNVLISDPGSPAEYTYQWYVNDNPIAGAMNSDYRHSTATAGTYSIYCIVSNSVGSVKSRVATLEVNYPRPGFTSGNLVEDNSGSTKLFQQGADWELVVLASELITTNEDMQIDLFMVGGGGGGGGTSQTSGGGGGGGGYVFVKKNFTLPTGRYTFEIGAGGTGGGTGNYSGTAGKVTRILDNSNAVIYSANGGGAGTYGSNDNGGEGGAGGSGGGGGSGGSGWAGGKGGSNGSNGSNGTDDPDNGTRRIGRGGAGSGASTYAFAENHSSHFYKNNAGLYLYSGGGCGGAGREGSWQGGGAGGGGTNGHGTANTGGGGGTGMGNKWGGSGSYNGGTGIIIIRNAR